MEPAFSLELTHSAKMTEGYALLRITLYTQQTAAEEMTDLPPKPANTENAEIFRTVLHYFRKA